MRNADTGKYWGQIIKKTIATKEYKGEVSD